MNFSAVIITSDKMANDPILGLSESKKFSSILLGSSGWSNYIDID